MRFAFVSDAVVTEERRDDWREIVPGRELRGQIAAELHRRDLSIVKDTEFVRVRAFTWLLATAAYSLSCTALAATRGRASPASYSHAALVGSVLRVRLQPLLLAARLRARPAGESDVSREQGRPSRAGGVSCVPWLGRGQVCGLLSRCEDC